MNTRTVKGTHVVHGVDPQKLVEKIIRERIYESTFWKDRLNTLEYESVLRVIDEHLHYVGGTYANTKPTPFLCLLQKLLQLQPSQEAINAMLFSPRKYNVALAAFYVRLTESSQKVFTDLEPLLSDHRRLRVRNRAGTFSLTTIDQFADQLLHEDRACDVILPRLTKRVVLEKEGHLEPLFKEADLSIAELSAPTDEHAISDRAGSLRLKKISAVKEEAEEDASVRRKDGGSMTVDETNALRAKLGLKPLKQQ